MTSFRRYFCYSRGGRFYYYASAFLIFTYIIVSYNYHKEQLFQPKIPDITRKEFVALKAVDILTMASQIPQMPIQQLLIDEHFSSDIQFGNKCTITAPSIWKIKFNNYYWQVLKTNSTASIYIFGAYYDDRLTPQNTISVRLSVMVDRVKLPVVYCQMWFPELKEPIFIQATFRLLWHPFWGNYQDDELLPYLITCTIPFKMRSIVPSSVSLVENICQNATNNLKVFNERNKSKQKPSFAVCVKGLAFQHHDMSLRLIEWIELLKLLGVEKIHFYELVIHPNISKVLSYYKKEGTVQVTKLSLPGNQPNFPELIEMYQEDLMVRKRLNELIPYNDCFYRNVHSYDFITLLDVDEIILPKFKSLFTWKDMMSLLNKVDKDSICASNTYFFDKWENENDTHIPKHLHMLRHVSRSANYSDPTLYVKCFHNTSSVIAVHNHLPFACARNRFQCNFHTVNPSLAHLQHYRKECTVHLKLNCDQLQKFRVEDYTIYQYAKKLIHNTEIVLKDLNFKSIL